MKSCDIVEEVAVLNEEYTWSHPVQVISDSLNRDTEMLLMNYSPADGDMREYVFQSIVDQFKGTDVIDDEEEHNYEEGTIF